VLVCFKCKILILFFFKANSHWPNRRRLTETFCRVLYHEPAFISLWNVWEVTFCNLVIVVLVCVCWWRVNWPLKALSCTLHSYKLKKFRKYFVNMYVYPITYSWAIFMFVQQIMNIVSTNSILYTRITRNQCIQEELIYVDSIYEWPCRSLIL